MKKLIGFRILLCATIAVFWVLSAAALRAEPLRLITDIDLGHFEHGGDGKGPGFSIEILQQVFAAMGQDVSFEYFPSGRAWSMIAGRERDGMSSVLRTSAREQICSFPDEPLDRDGSVLFVRTADIGTLKFLSFDDFLGHDVAVNRPFLPASSEHPALSPELDQFLREHHNMMETNGDAEGLRMLAAGRVDYMVMDLNLGKREIRAQKLSGKIEPLPARPVIIREINTCFTKSRVSPALVDAYSRALKQFKQTAAFQAIYRKYLP